MTTPDSTYEWRRKGEHVTEDHAKVARVLAGLTRPWILTYDDAAEIRLLYRKHRQYNFAVNYSVQTKRTGTELMIVSDGLMTPADLQALSAFPNACEAA